MPLVVPALRLFVVFLNVYETFKTLKLPPLKRRGQPSIRSLTQRKRDLKGCLAIWIVWSCYAAYERTFDRIFSFLVPFHNEMKSVLLLFLLVTRAKGAEPLYLHVIRPFIKPYSVIVDPSLEVAHDIGDFLFALLQVPLDYFHSVWSTWHIGELDAASNGASSDAYTGSHESIQSGDNTGMPILATPRGDTRTLPQAKLMAPVRSRSNNKRLLNKSQPPMNTIPCESSTRERHSKPAPTMTHPGYNAHLLPHDPSRYSQTLPRNSRHQMRYPPVPVYGSDTSAPPPSAEFGIITTSTHGISRTVSYNPRSVREYQSDEWRSYPAFPSAYPPTPLPALASLPSPVARSRSERHYPPISEDSTSVPDFHLSLEQQYELKHSGSVRHSSEQCGNFTGVHSRRDLMEPAIESTDESSDAGGQSGFSEPSHVEDSDVDHDATLRSPYRFRQMNGVAPSPSTSSVSLASRSTTLTTADDASSITRASSESLYSYDSSHSKKNRVSHPRSRNATLRGRPLGVQLSHDSFQSEDSEGSADSGIGVKPQRVLTPRKRTTHLRPVAKVAEPSRKNTVAAKGAPARAKTMTAATRTRVSGKPASSGVSTIRGAGITTGPRRSQQEDAEFARGTASTQARTVRGKAT